MKSIKYAYVAFGGALCAAFFSPLGPVGLFLGVSGLVVAVAFGILAACAQKQEDYEFDRPNRVRAEQHRIAKECQELWDTLTDAELLEIKPDDETTRCLLGLYRYERENKESYPYNHTSGYFKWETKW